jgi:hypothetical protein
MTFAKGFFSSTVFRFSHKKEIRSGTHSRKPDVFLPVFSVSKLWQEPLKKLAGAPFFLRRGGLGQLFVHFALLSKKKRNSHGIFQK